ncbi:hypothetical protein BO85DRAFT_463978 [Aspergillus piperis CBS 112811]|uniref:Uncharacterized protein n=1 Tax=Aspergillus piperis CBS 112811 TaxID=1448313 RepID=A0A8G1VHN6_9EURO|nr:hypothetical protein BO85DRAFT_463978 [Aspergillus piperis CBS 112811]RAH52402.1 hypothetical protein BO85DRAFT_463978 [Aspergillus piperis CBS 112811]
MGRGFFALATTRAVFSVFRPKLASLVRLQLRHGFAVELDHGCCLVRPCGSANRLCPEAGFRVDRQNDAELLVWYGWLVRQSWRAQVTVRQPTILLETIELYGPRANAPPTTNTRTPSASVRRIKNSKNDPLQYPIKPLRSPIDQVVKAALTFHVSVITVTSWDTPTNPKAPSMDGEWGGGKERTGLLRTNPSPAKAKCQSCPEQPDPSGTQEDTATVDLGILSTSQRSDPLLRTTNSTVNSLWAEAPKRWTMGEGKKTASPTRELVIGRLWCSKETHAMTGRCSAETFASRDNNNFSRWTVGTGPSIVIVIPLVLPLRIDPM